MEADDIDDVLSVQDSAGERLIADRLDALEAERVMQRALELEAEALDEPHVITTEQLGRIAKEVGVDPAFVQQALGEVRLEPKARSRFARWVLPDDLVESATIAGLSRDEAEAAITKWMTQYEGLVPGGILGDGIEWDVDRRLRTRLLARSLSGGNRISRVAGGDVSHRVHSATESQHVVSMQSEGRWPLTFAALVLAVGGAFALLVVLGAAVSGDLLLGIGAFAGLAAALVATALGGARWWARGISRALRRSIVGLLGMAQAKPKRSFPNFPRLPSFRRRDSRPKDS